MYNHVFALLKIHTLMVTGKFPSGLYEVLGEMPNPMCYGR
jgi:hypothetical protein